MFSFFSLTNHLPHGLHQMVVRLRCGAWRHVNSFRPSEASLKVSPAWLSRTIICSAVMSPGPSRYGSLFLPLVALMCGPSPRLIYRTWFRSVLAAFDASVCIGVWSTGVMMVPTSRLLISQMVCLCVCDCFSFLLPPHPSVLPLFPPHTTHLITIYSLRLHPHTDQSRSHVWLHWGIGCLQRGRHPCSVFIRPGHRAGLYQ